MPEEDESEKKETQDNEEEAEQHDTLLISKIQDDKKSDDVDADGFKHFGMNIPEINVESHFR